jgi:hypothetical protein
MYTLLLILLQLSQWLRFLACVFIIAPSNYHTSGVSVFKRMTVMNEWRAAMPFVCAPIWLQ